MARYLVTKHFAWTFEIEADSAEEAERVADERELSGADLIGDGYLSTDVERDYSEDEYVNLPASMRQFFDCEFRCEDNGGVSPATLDSAVDSLTQAPAHIISGWAGIDIEETEEFIRDVQNLRDTLGGRTHLADLL